VSGDGARGEEIVVVALPAELVDQRPEHETRVGAAAGDHDARAAVERFGDREGREVDVRARDAVAHGREGRARVHVAQLLALREERVEVREHVVALDDADADARKPCFRMTFITACMHARGLTPPALATTRMSFATRSGRMRSIISTKSVA
jgi:hypothetical protein